MPSVEERALPFPRGYTAVDGTLTPGDGWRQDELEGKVYWAPDTIHNTGIMVGLMAVKNDTGAAITVARQCGEFSLANTYDFGRRIGTFPCNTEGAVALPLDDAYTVGATIADDDIFYVIVKGPCSIDTEGVSNFAAGMSLMSSALGCIRNLAQPTAGSFVLGTLAYAASYTANTTAVVYVDAFPLRLPTA